MILKCNRTLKTVLFTSLFIGHGLVSASTLEIPQSSVSAPSSLGEIRLFHDDQGFHVEQKDEITFVENCWVDPILQDASNEDLEEYLTSGRIFVSQMDSGEFSLRTKLCLKGSGPIAGMIAYWATKTLCYGTAVAGAAGAVVATGGAAGAAAGAMAAASTAGASTAAVVVGGAIAGGGLATEAAMATTAVVTSAGGLAAAAAAVETASLGALGFFTAIPFLP